MDKKIYITTPIYYANGSPHIGHFTTTTAADALVRYYREKEGKNAVLFTTGTDEHGTKVAETAKKEGFDAIQDYVDARAKEFKESFDKTRISYDYFVRTTHPDHKIFAKDFIKKLIKSDDVYKKSYKGTYCTGCEKFLTKSELTEKGHCPDHRPDQVVEVEEENYFFKLSKYSDKLKELIEKDVIKIIPENKKNEMLARIEEGLEDVSISRPKEKVSWGIEFPNDSEQTVYVWVEALINYLSSLKIKDKNEFWKGKVVHLVGKEISWFHNIIWPAMLLSTGYDLFKESFVHSFLIVGGKKMSKSLGNVISPDDLLDKYGVDGARYLALSNLPYKNDSDVTLELLDTKYNADLANGLGNLISRITKLCEDTNYLYSIDLADLDDEYVGTKEKLDSLITKYKLHDVCNLFDEQVKEVNKLIHDNKPWEDLENSVSFLERVLNKTIYTVDMFKFILPETEEKVIDHFKLREGRSKIKIKHLTGLYPRL